MLSKGGLPGTSLEPEGNKVHLRTIWKIVNIRSKEKGKKEMKEKILKQEHYLHQANRMMNTRESGQHLKPHRNAIPKCYFFFTLITST